MAWSDYADFSSIDKLRLTAPYDGIIAVLKAVNERVSAYSTSLITEVNRLEAILPLTIQNTISTLITKYVKHLDNSGVWTGKETIPFWNETDILTEIGATERIAAPMRLDQLSVKWLYQQYQIINLLLWYGDDGDSAAAEGIYSGTVATNENAITAMDEAVSFSLNNIGAGSFTILRNGVSNSSRENYSNVLVYDTSCDISNKKLSLSYTSTKNKNLIVYIYADDDPHPAENKVFDSAGTGYARKYNIAYTENGHTASSFTSAFLGSSSAIPAYPAAAPYPPSTINISGWGSVRSKDLIIQKFDIPGGFEFV